MKKTFKVILIILALVLVILIAGIVIMGKFLGSALDSREVADYDKRIEIWSTVAGNTEKSKLNDMNIDYNANKLSATLAFAEAIVNPNYTDEERTIDTFTYFYEIKSGYEKETYEDIPYLIPYTIEKSKGAVVVIPGGGYGYKSMDGGTSEGKDIALTLNKNGYSAFVLHYRSNPYEYPIPQLDVQRAVRYLRSNAAEYGFHPDNIALIGYSAGGNQIGMYINQIQGKDLFPADYTPDDIDKIDDRIIAAGMIYPALSYNANVPMLFCSFNDELVRNESERNKLLDMLDLSKHFNSGNIPQLVAYGTKDGMVGMDEAKKYITAAKESGTDITEISAEGQDHGFAQKYYMNKWLDLLNKTIK